MRLVLLIGIFATVTIYSAVVHRKARDQKWQWWHTFTATLMSVLAAFLIGLQIFSMQLEEHRDEMQDALTADLLRLRDKFDTIDPMTLTIKATDAAVDLPLTYSQPSVLREALVSGFLDQQDTIQLSRIADNIGTYNTLVQYAIAVLGSADTSSPDFYRRARHVAGMLEKTRKLIVLQCDDFLARL